MKFNCFDYSFEACPGDLSIQCKGDKRCRRVDTKDNCYWSEILKTPYGPKVNGKFQCNVEGKDYSTAYFKSFCNPPNAYIGCLLTREYQPGKWFSQITTCESQCRADTTDPKVKYQKEIMIRNGNYYKAQSTPTIDDGILFANVYTMHVCDFVATTIGSCMDGQTWLGGKCEPCRAGFYFSNGFEKTCWPGSYQDEIGATSCKNCPKYTFTIDDGLKSASGCLSCPYGYECKDNGTFYGGLFSRMARLAMYAGEAQSSDEKIYLKDLTIFEDQKAETRAITGYDSDLNAVVLSFRGTKSLENLIQDVTFIPTDFPICPGCVVHKGFLTAYNSLKSKSVINNMIDLSKKYPNARVIVTGHSLGGAMSHLAAIDLSVLNLNVSIYTFGSPRTGNKMFAEFFNKQILGDNFRITYKNDPIPMVPPNNILGFYHAGTEIHYVDFMRYGVLPTYYDSSPSWRLNLDDHFQYKYILDRVMIR